MLFYIYIIYIIYEYIYILYIERVFVSFIHLGAHEHQIWICLLFTDVSDLCRN